MAIIGRDFDPEFDSGCHICDEEFPMRELFYNPDSGEHTCDNCHNERSFEESMEYALKVAS